MGNMDLVGNMGLGTCHVPLGASVSCLDLLPPTQEEAPSHPCLIPPS